MDTKLQYNLDHVPAKIIGKSPSNSMFDTALNLLNRIIWPIVRLFAIIIYGRRGKTMPPIDDPLLLDSATTIAHKIRTKQVTSTQVMIAYIRRIQQINPLLNCVVDVRFKDALTDANTVDELIASNKFTLEELKRTKPFLGVPISTKDAIGVKGMLFTSGIWLRRNVRAEEDADVIHLMREAGAIPLAVTNVSELCLWWESYNTVFGRSNNPFNTNRTVGGSSGGEGCLIGAGGSPFGIGSDFAGSIRLPCFFNGIFGHLPSPFIVSARGHYPALTSIVEHASAKLGPMSKSACDLKPMLKIIAGDNAKLLNLDEPVDLSTLKYFYQENEGGNPNVSQVDEDIKIGLAKVVHYFTNRFNKKPQKVFMTKMKNASEIWFGNVIGEEKGKFEHQLANMNGQIHLFRELLKWMIGMSKYTLISLLVCMRFRYEFQYGSPAHQKLVKELDEFKGEFDELLGDSGVFIYPTHPTVAPYHNEPFTKSINCCYTSIFNALGLPSTAVPLGIGKEGLPIGIQVVANRNQDRLCLAVACELERAFGGWVAPKIFSQFYKENSIKLSNQC